MTENIKRVSNYIVCDVYIWLIVLGETLLYKFFNTQGSLSYEIKYIYMAMISTIITCILLGLGFAYLFNKKQASSKKELILEVCIIGIPAILFSIGSIPLGGEVIVQIQLIMIKNMRLASQVGGIIIGIEIFKIINFIKIKKVTQDES